MPTRVLDRLALAAQPFDTIESAPLDDLLARIGDARLVLLGEASHGTAEFYRMRARITRELVQHAGVTIVALEADWPDAARIDAYVLGAGRADHPEAAFSRFPEWMWRNHEVLEFVEWVREWNDARGDAPPVRIYGMDLYSLYSSMQEVVRFLDQVDPDVAQLARQRYGCLTPYEDDPAWYGLAALQDRHARCEEQVVANLVEIQQRRGELLRAGADRFLDAEQNARLAANAERYYRAMYRGSAESWNLRDRHRVETLEALLAFHGPASRAVVWAHNSHLGNAAATEMAQRGETNVGELVRTAYGRDAYLVGFGTDHGTVAAADDWGAPVRIKDVVPAREDSYERLCHDTGIPNFLLPLRDEPVTGLRDELAAPRLERAIGVVYRPETERASHYFYARLPDQFDEYVWLDETTAVQPLGGGRAPDLRDGHPFEPIDR